MASSNIEAELNKPYRHNVYGYLGIHDPQENASAQVRHVECTDCHNGHAVTNQSASAPNASGKIKQVQGIDSNGNQVTSIQYEYQLCYRCHADNTDKPSSPTTRSISQNNVRLEFDPNNPSFHPIEAAGINSDVPSLIPPLTESSIIYCTDCHAGNSGSSGGPHGSIYPQILKYNYSKSDYQIESYSAYELCYQCHDRNAIINKDTNKFFKEVHRKHIQEEDAPCNACHDPHGISSSQGNSTNNSHLINFDISIVSKNRDGQRYFEDRGYYRGACYLMCHGEDHHAKDY